MQCMQKAEPLQSSMLELQEMSMSMSMTNTSAAKKHAQDAQRGGSPCVKPMGEQHELCLSEY